MPHDEPSDADDVRLSLGGDREAFGRLYDRHARLVRAVVVAVSSDFSAVEDLTQETFLRGYRRLTTLQDANSFRPWIQGIARLVARERRRELSRNRHYFEADDNKVSQSEESLDGVENIEEQNRIVSAIAALPERERLAVHAYYFEEQDANQAAKAIGLSRSGFYVALERGMARIRKQLGVTSSPSNARRKR